MSDGYTYWENALKGEFGPIHDGIAFPGFYRRRTGKAGGYLPVAIWEHDGEIVALQDGKPANASDLWSYCADKPISHEHYTQRMETGKWWDEDDSVTASMGHNNGPTDPAEILSEQITAALAGVDAYTEVKDDETAAKAQSLRSRLLELSGDADKKRAELVRPFLDGEKATNLVWMPLVRTAKEGANAIRTAISAYETKKDREAKAEAAKAGEARRKALEAAQARAPIGVTVQAEDIPLPPAPVPAPKAQIRGAYGKAASVKTIKAAIVKDQDAAYKQFRDHPQIVALIQTLANAAVKAGGEVAGCEVEETKDIR